MARIDAVCDSGPLIHLSEAGAFDALSSFGRVLIPEEVFEEVCGSELPGSAEVRNSKLVSVVRLDAHGKNFAKLVCEKYSLGLGESAGMALARQAKIPLFLTDDLQARLVSGQLGFTPHGTVGVILRAYRKKVLARKDAIGAVNRLQTASSLFLTSDLVRYVLDEIGKT